MIETASSVGGSLARYSAIVASAVERHLDGLADAEYLAGPVGDYPARRGKALRPSLCMATCEAFGGATEHAVPSALAIELLHNAFLVHDDIEDGSLLRRGQPTLHRRYGLALALNAGDALAFQAVSALRENVDRLGGRIADRVMTEFEFANRQTVAGQAREIGWSRDNRLDLSPDDYLELVMKKTCWYTTVLPLRVGALIGSWGTADLEPMIGFGFSLGAAFQIRDDILNLVGDPGVYGKERFGDLREGKRTLILIHLLAVAEPADRRWLEGYLSRESGRRSAGEAARLFELMVAYGSIGFAGEFAAGVARSAEAAMEAAFAGLPDTPARRFVADLVPFMVERVA